MPFRPLRRDRPGNAVSIRALLIAFALALVLPMLGFAGFLLWRFADLEEARVTEKAHQSAEQIAFAIDRELTNIVATLHALATSPLLQTGEFAAFHARAVQALRVPGGHVVLRDRTGQQLVNTRRPYGEPLPRVTGREADDEVLRTAQPAVSDLRIGAASQQPTTVVSVPVLRNGEVVHLLSMSAPPAFWLEVLRQNMLDPNGSVGLIDRKGLFIARLRNHAQWVGRHAGEDLNAVSGDQGSVVRTNIEGQQVLFSYHRPKLSRWLVGVGVPTEALRAPLRRSLMLLVGACAIVLALSSMLAAALGSRIAQPIRALTAKAARLGRGGLIERRTTGVAEIDEVVAALAAASVDLRERGSALRQSEERYRLATEAFQGAVFDYDVAANRSERSARAGLIVGAPASALPATREGWQDRIHPEDKPAFLAARDALYAGRASQYDTEYRVRREDGSWAWVWHRALGIRGEDGTLRRVIGAVLDITARRQAEEQLKLMVNELNHRVKNTLATIQSIAAHTLRGARTVEEGKAAFEARLLALSNAHNILTRENWEGANLRRIVADTLAPHQARAGERFAVRGPDVWVTPANAVALAMALHELATNAAKYGALTTPAGAVTVAWTIETGTEPQRVRLTWTETGGPPVTPPSRRGFGSRLIARSLAEDPAGEVQLDYRPEGLVCTLVWSLNANRAAAEPSAMAELPSPTL